MISAILFSFLALEGLQVCIFAVEVYMGLVFFSFLRRREENKVAFGSAESIEEAGLLLWVSSEINLLLLSGQSVMSFLNRRVCCSAKPFDFCSVMSMTPGLFVS